ncbi:nitrite reductase, partial [Kitasatospora sp. NPDC047058]|uniref:nitrite reductase n=1 Tax=Kitasatospora sp. NPDC047058 TaxID=3155620 RepID=UPI003410139F
HTADDGALARVRLPGGLLTDRQALALADAAEALGDGGLETTSRGNVQLRGLASDCGAQLADRLRAAGLLPSETHERVRNIVASPGPSGGRADVQAWARELDAGLCASGWATGLSGKFLFALDDGRGDVAALDADVTLIAGSGAGPGDGPGAGAGAAPSAGAGAGAADPGAGAGAHAGADGGTVLLRLGRAATARAVPAAGAVDAALAAAREFLDALRESGRKAWHLRDVPDLLPPGTTPLPALPGAPPPLGALPGGLSVGLRFGRATAAQWRALVAASAGELRLTPWRGVVLPGASADRLPALAAAGLRTAPGTAWDGASACTGLPGCAKSLADVRTDAARALDRPGPGPAAGNDPARPSGLRVHWSGCERRCGHPAGRWVDVLATGQGYRVAVDGTAVDVTNEEMAEAVAEARRTTK